MISTAALIGTYSRAGWITLISCLMIYFILLGKNYFRKTLWKLTTFVAGTAIVFVIMASMPRANLFYRAKLIVHDNYLPHNISDRMDVTFVSDPATVVATTAAALLLPLVVGLAVNLRAYGAPVLETLRREA